MQGWLNYYGIAGMKNRIEELNQWMYHRVRMCIWKYWKKPKRKFGIYASWSTL
uniref:group II intron maturase-specific domain-containing protein n=1 Tax=Selenomonas sp. TAMA-11512 TaxID=3095337 RepID=UPI00403F370D